MISFFIYQVWNKKEQQKKKKDPAQNFTGISLSFVTKGLLEKQSACFMGLTLDGLAWKLERAYRLKNDDALVQTKKTSMPTMAA